MPIYLLCLPKNIAFNLWPDILLQGVYQGVLAATIQLMLYTRAVQLIGAAGMGSMMAIVPILAGVSALFVFDETLKPSLIVAMILVSVGVWLANNTKNQASLAFYLTYTVLNGWQKQLFE